MTDHKDLYVLLLLNGIIVLAAETIGGGLFFFETGLIQVFAGFFTALAVVRIVTNKQLHDPALKKMVHGCMFALLVFSESHLFAFVAETIGLSEDAVKVSVVNFYLAGLLLLIIGAQFVLKIRSEKRSSVIVGASVFSLLLLSALTAATALHDPLISLDPSGPTPSIYGALILFTVFFSAITMREATKVMKVFERFWRYMMVGGTFIGAAALANVLHAVLRKAAGMPEHQVAYAAFFSFCVAASLMFLAFGSVKRMGGVYADIDTETA